MKINPPTPVPVEVPTAPPTATQMIAKALKELSVGANVTFSPQIVTWLASQGVK